MPQTPIIPAHSLEDLVSQVVGDPKCHNSQCHGRGYIGIGANPDGSKYIMLCRCGRYGRTEYVRIMKEFKALEELVFEMSMHVAHTENNTPPIWIRRKLASWKRKIQVLRKGKVPVTGSVKADASPAPGKEIVVGGVNGEASKE